MTTRKSLTGMLTALAAGLVLGIAPTVFANTPEINIHHGRIWHTVGYDGADGWNSYIIYPGGVPVSYTESEYLLTRQWNDHTRKGGTYLMTTNFTDPNGATWPNTCSYMFRSMDYSYPSVFNGNFNYVWPLGMIRDIRWERPQVVINDSIEVDFAGPNGLDTPNQLYPSYGNDPRPPFTTVSDLVTEMASEVQFRYVQGVKITRRVYSFPQGTPHQDYVIYEVTLTNDGVHGDPDALPGTYSRIADTTGIPEIPEQTINKMLWWQATDIQTHAGSGIIASPPQRNDQNGKYVQPWPGVENSAVLTWDEDEPTVDGADYGDVGGEDVENIMVGNAFVMSGPLFVSTGPGANYDVNLTGQPLLRIFYYERGWDLAGKDYSPIDMDQQRSMSANGLLQMTLDESYEDNPLVAAVRDHEAGPTFLLGFGPAGGDLAVGNETLHGWDLAPGESVKIVNVLAVGGIDLEEGRRIGQFWNQQKAASAAPETWMPQADIDLYMTGEDTARKAVNLAYWNYWGTFAPGVTSTDLANWGIPNHIMTKPAAYNQPYNVPEAPRPPSGLWVSTPTEGGVQVAWGIAAEQDGNDFDTGVWDLEKYRIYRQAGSRFATWEVVAEGPPGWFAKVDGDDTKRYFIDADTQPGVEYWYAVVAVDDGTQNWAEPGVPLESGRWWTWSGFMPNTGVTPLAVRPAAVEDGMRPEKLALHQNAPNPFNPSTVITYTLDQDYDNLRMSVYDVLGCEVRTLVSQSMSAGTHQVSWDGRDNNGREAASGVYLVRLTTPNGDRSIKMLLVR